MPTYNIVNEGADKNGNTAIDSVLDSLVGSDTTIVFPSGTYKLNDLTVPSGTNNLELIAPNGARLVPGQSGDSVQWIGVASRGFVLDGFELDMRNVAVPPYVKMDDRSGDWELRRLITRGKVRAATDTNVGSNDSGDARTYFRLSAAAGTRGLIQDCYFHEGACDPGEASNRRAVLVESGSGELLFNRCWFEHWAENTIYGKKPLGRMKIYNCFLRNTQNGMRLGGNSEVNNTVSIKNAEHPRQAWSNGSLQRGVNSEANVPANRDAGVDSYDGTLTVANSDFYHRYQSSSCGGAITAPIPAERMILSNVRISYNSTKNHDAIYTYAGEMNDGTPVNLKSLRLRNVDVRNDHSSEYGIFIGLEPDSWETVSGTIGGTGPATNSSYVRDRMTIGRNPTPPVTNPALPSPPPVGKVPMQSAQVVRIDNTGNGSSSTFDIRGGEFVLPGGDDGATVNMGWASPLSARRVPNSTRANGTIPAGEEYVFYVTGGIESTSGSGPATWTVDGQPYVPGVSLVTKTLSTNQPDRDTWTEAQTGVSQSLVVVTKPLSYNGGEPCHTRLQNVGSGSFEYKLEEWLYLGGSHATETVHMLAMRPTQQEIELDNGSSYPVKAGTVSTDDSFSTVSFGGFFNTRPVVFTKSQTFNGSDPIVTRVRNVSSGSFDVRVQEETGLDSHTTETVGYIALAEQTGQIGGHAFEVNRAAAEVSDKWYRIEFNQEYDDPQFIADMQTYDGPDLANLRYRNLTGTGVDVKVEEEQSGDEETAHTTEVVGYTVFEGSQ